jgi:formylglycine-generating enzyme required for sulfatase activity
LKRPEDMAAVSPRAMLFGALLLGTLLTGTGCRSRSDGPRPVKRDLELEQRQQGACPDGMVAFGGGVFRMGTKGPDEPELKGGPLPLDPVQREAAQLERELMLSDEAPAHEVTLSAFCLDRFEAAGADGLPIVKVSRDAARAYCAQRGKRLPTEAEWEFAARGPRGRPYPWGDAEPDCRRANFNACDGKVAVVGTHPAGASPEGVHDLAGNVWEWVDDCYSRYPDRPVKDPHIDGACDLVVNRGGSWAHPPSFLRSAFRGGASPEVLYDVLGFRCAQSPELKP